MQFNQYSPKCSASWLEEYLTLLSLVKQPFYAPHADPSSHALGAAVPLMAHLDNKGKNKLLTPVIAFKYSVIEEI